MKSFAAQVRDELENIEGESLQCEMAQSAGFRLFSKDNANYKSKVDWNLLPDEAAMRAFLRGAFLAGGYINDPHKNYHAEILVPFSSLRRDFENLLEGLGLPNRHVKKHRGYAFYFKDSEIIGDFLGIMGANKSMLDFLTIKVEKEDSGNLNRKINIETANYDKTISASLKQIEHINKIGIESLPKPLREIARLRLDNPTKSLAELAALAGTSKSHINQELTKIMKLSI
ncbi:MAG: DNA-binding protein WhiA [Oscillospiraceae bacterium]|nr:DNA-binding protein WhiA [Oscillospiraceae bacterium]